MHAISAGAKQPWPPQAFDVLAKPVGADCPFRCRYCYYRKTEKLYEGSPKRMPDEVLHAFTRQYIESQDADEVSFGWQGGEPLLAGLDFFERALSYQARYAPAHKRMVNFVQTSGALVDDAWASFFKEHDILVGISIDGPSELHDAFRVDEQGSGTAERALRGLRTLQERGVELNVLTCVHSANASHGKRVYRYLRDDLGVRHIQLIPVVELEPDGRTVTAQSVTAAAYGDFLIEVFDEWVRGDVGRVFVQTFDATLAAWVGAAPGLCTMARTCGAALVLEHNGDVYSCDHFVNPAHRLGNLLETPLRELVASKRQRRFGRAKLDNLAPACKRCGFRSVCGGGCPKHRREKKGNRNVLCQAYKRFFSRAAPFMDFMANELAYQRPPANVMSMARDRSREQQ